MSADMPAGTVVLACLSCRKVTILGSGSWISMIIGDWREPLKTLAGNVEVDKNTFKEVMETPIEDPRWEAIS
jgi:hypothetical protein